MKKYPFSILVLALIFSPLAWGNRFHDSWNAGHNHIRMRFYPNHKGEGAPVGLFLMSSTSATTTSSTSFTSGQDLAAGAAKAELRTNFIDENFYALKLESAKGQGEYLQTLAILSGCEQPEAQTQFGSKVRSNFKAIYDSASTQEPGEISKQIDQLIDDDPVMQKACRSDVAS
jgi:hypothetical protein